MKRLLWLLAAAPAIAQISVTISRVPVETVHPDGLPRGWRATLYSATACNGPDQPRTFDAGQVIALAQRHGVTVIPAQLAENASREAPRRTRKAIAWRWVKIALVGTAAIVGQAEGVSEALKIAFGSGAAGAIILDEVSRQADDSGRAPVIPVQPARSGVPVTLGAGACSPEGSLVFAAGGGPDTIIGSI